MRLESFWPGILFSKGIFFAHFCRVASDTVGDCWRRRHVLTREGDFEKGASNPGAVVPGVLVQGAFGRGCTVLCNISKRSKCVETIPHVEKLSICHILCGLKG